VPEPPAAQADEIVADKPASRAYGRQSLQARREDQYRRLIQAARDTFAEHGYHGTSIEDIVGRAHVSRTSFYRFFSDKEECLLAIFWTGSNIALRAVEEIASSDLPAEERLREGVGVFLRLLAGDPAMARVTLIEVMGATRAAEEARVEVRERYVQIIEDYLNVSGLWKGRPKMETRLMAVAAMAGIGEAVSHLITTGRLDEWKQAVDPLGSFLVRALIPQDRRGRS